MVKLYDFLSKNKWLIWVFILLTTGLFTYHTLQCKLEENIFKLLPQTENLSESEQALAANTPDLAFTSLKLKDKIMVQVVPVEGTNTEEANTITTEDMAAAMDLFMEHAMQSDSARGYIDSQMYDVDPALILEAADYLMQHGVSYLDVTPEELDSLTTEQHIREVVRLYLQVLETDLGQNFYDVLSYDPCGLSLKTVPQHILDKIQDESDAEANMPSTGAFQHNHIFAGKGQACIGFITPTFGSDDSKKAGKLMKSLDKARDEVESTYPGLTVRYHGTVVLAAGNSNRIKMDLVTTIGIALIIIIILLAISLKRPTYLLLMLFPIGYGALFALATIYTFRGWMSLMALGLGAIVLGVALSYCLHVLIFYVYTGNARLTVMKQSKPVFLGALTTIGAFAGLLFTKSSLLQDFGAFALLTVVGTTVISLIVMPQFLPKKSTPNKKIFAAMDKFNAYAPDQNKWICGIVCIWCLVCICFSGKYEFDSNLVNIGYFSNETKAAMASWDKMQNSGLKQQYYASYATDLETALEQLPAIEARVDSLRKAGVIRSTMKVSTMMPSLLLQEERIAAWQEYFTEDKQAEVWRHVQAACQKEGVDAEMFAPFRELMAAPAEPELLAETGLLPDEIMNNFMEEASGTTLVYFPVKTTEENVKHVKDELTEIHGCMVLDPYYYSSSLVEIIHKDFNLIMLISSIFVLVLLLLTYRNVWLALIAFFPMTVSWYTVLGAMALFGQPFNLINIVVSSFIFGIGVDYSIFIMDGLLKGDDSKTMLYHKTAITLSALVLIICMFSLWFAEHPALHSIAFASMAGMVTTMMLSYTIQPNLYRWYVRFKEKKHQKETK